MAVSSGFFNSQNHDRRYDAEQMSQIFDGIIEDGVYQNVGTAFNVTAGPGNMQVTVGTGRAWLMNTWTLNDSDYVLDIQSASLSTNRVDCIAIEVDKRKSVRENKIVYVVGTGADKPSLAEDTDHRQYPLAYVTVGVGVTQIYQKDIEYVPGTEPLPFVRSPLETLNISNVLQQFDSEFNLWFDTVKDIIDESDVGDLANQLVDIHHRIDANAAQIDRLVKEVFDPSQGQNLGTHLTTAQKTAIENGSFSGLYPGDYWEINGIKWYIIDYDYYMKFTPNDGTPACTKHHLVVMPDKLFAVDGIVDVSYPMAGDYTIDEGREESPFIITRFSYVTGGSQPWGSASKAFIANKPLTTSTGFDWISPSNEAISLAVNAFGEDNLVSVPDVNGTMESFMQDFEWKTYNKGVLIPHFLDCQSLYGSKTSGFGYLTCFNGINNGKLSGSTTSDFKYSTAQYSGFHAQRGSVFPENGQYVRYYLDSNSSNRVYLSERFVPNSGFATKITDIPNLGNALKSSITNPTNSQDIKVYLRDAYDQVAINFGTYPYGSKNEVVANAWGGEAILASFADFNTDVYSKLLSVDSDYHINETFEQYTMAGYNVTSVGDDEKYHNRMRCIWACGGYGAYALVPIPGVSAFTGPLGDDYARANAMTYRFSFVNSSGTETVPCMDGVKGDRYMGTGTGRDAYIADYVLKPVKFKIFSSFNNTYDEYDNKNFTVANRNLTDYYYPIVCCVG